MGPRSSLPQEVLMARMLGVCQKLWCPSCRSPGGLDCPDVSKDKGAARAAEKRQWRWEALTSAADNLRDIQMDNRGAI